VKQTANLTLELKEQSFVLHDLPALIVRYRNPNSGGEEMESVYVVSGSQTFSSALPESSPVSLWNSLATTTPFSQW
jgi:dihydrofolate reductase